MSIIRIRSTYYVINRREQVIGAYTSHVKARAARRELLAHGSSSC